MKLLIVLILLSGNFIYAAEDTLRSELGMLLKKRQELLNEYNESTNKKSGLFGNKTKNDLRDSQAKLKEIVEADNKIMTVLNRTVDYRNYEKINLTFDATSYVTRIENLTSLNESLMKSNKKYSEEITSYKSDIKKYKLYNILLLAILVATIIFSFGRKYLKL